MIHYKINPDSSEAVSVRVFQCYLDGFSWQSYSLDGIRDHVKKLRGKYPNLAGKYLQVMQGEKFLDGSGSAFRGKVYKFEVPA